MAPFMSHIFAYANRPVLYIHLNHLLCRKFQLLNCKTAEHATHAFAIPTCTFLRLQANKHVRMHLQGIYMCTDSELIGILYCIPAWYIYPSCSFRFTSGIIMF
jgi:hypothetical protein